MDPFFNPKSITDDEQYLYQKSKESMIQKESGQTFKYNSLSGSYEKSSIKLN